MEFHPIMIDDNTNLTCYNDEDTLEKLKSAKKGSHYIIVYSDLPTLRKIYSQHIKRQIEEKKEIVLILPHHETTDMVRYVLFELVKMDVRKYE
jgi:ssDNA-binding Zn-finger/Zn-ribbon topoisomerase 1